ncbi:MAG: outer membrane lipoprotein-sorting protein [Rhodothermales bacterium]
MRPFFVLAALFFGLAQPTAAQPQDARAIFEEVEQRQEQVTDETAQIQMEIVDPKGRTRTREMTIYTQSTGDATRSLLVFSAPADVRGMGLLTLEEDGEEEQKLYLPALRRVQRIAGSQRGERFAGSDFTYEDLGTRDADDFDLDLTGTSDSAWTIEAVPLDADSRYSRIVFAVDRARYVIREATYYDRDGDAWKKLTADDFEQVADGSWRAGRMTMADVQDERKTRLVFLERQTGEPLSEDLFTERQLQRGLR